MVANSAMEVSAKIVDQGNLVRELKAKKADKTEIKAAVDVLLALKAEFKSACGIEWKPGVDVPPVDANQENAPPGEPINSKVIAQGDKIRSLKANKAPQEEIKAAVTELLALKAEYKTATGKDWVPPGGGNVSSSKKDTKPKGETVVLGGKLSADDAKVLKDAAAEGLDIKIKSCGDLIRKLKAEKHSKEIIDEEVKVLLLLKDLYKEKTGRDWKPDMAATKEKVAKVQGATAVVEGYVN